MSYTVNDVYYDQAKIVLERMYTSYTKEELEFTRLALYNEKTTDWIKERIYLNRRSKNA